MNGIALCRASIALLLCAGFAWGADMAFADGPESEFPATTRRVDRGQLMEAMQLENAKGYNLLVSTTAGRFTAAVLLDLVARARGERPEGPALWLHYDDWFEAYRVCLGLDSGAVPEFVTLQRVHHQSQYVAYSSAATRVEVRKGPVPRQVMRVWAGWPDSAGAVGEYTFVDTAAQPDMQVTNERFISYWLVDYGEFVLQDEIQGIRGRPLEGALGVAFKVVGSGRADWSRSLITQDGLLLAYACARKGPFSVHPTTTTLPGGQLMKGLPPGRNDLKPIVERLKQDVELTYPPDQQP